MSGVGIESGGINSKQNALNVAIGVCVMCIDDVLRIIPIVGDNDISSVASKRQVIVQGQLDYRCFNSRNNVFRFFRRHRRFLIMGVGVSWHQHDSMMISAVKCSDVNNS